MCGLWLISAEIALRSDAPWVLGGPPTARTVALLGARKYITRILLIPQSYCAPLTKMHAKMPFRLRTTPLTGRVTAHADHADAGPGPGTSVIAGPAAAASCVLDVWGGSAVRELDLGAISMRHAMRDDGIGSRQEQLSLTRSSLTVARWEAVRAEGYDR